MFDYVKYKANCRKCGEPLDNFQSKDGECLLETIEPKDVKRFYTDCDKCGTWNEFEVTPKNGVDIRVLKDGKLEKHMKIYKISQTENNDYDTYDSAVVCAENEEEARLMHPDGAYNYREEKSEEERWKKADRPYGTWAKKEYVKVELLGEAKEGLKIGVIIDSFNAG